VSILEDYGHFWPLHPNLPPPEGKGVEGLRDVIIGPGLQACNNIFPLVFPREENQGGRGEVRRFTNAVLRDSSIP